GDGVDTRSSVSGGRYHVIEHVRSILNGGDGIRVTHNTTIERSVAAENSGSGILGGDAVIIRDTQVIENLGHGVSVAMDAHVEQCHAESNGGSG
ncbi:hypothetical protein DF186_15095, partial [Enterococcus hirae]